MKKSLVILTALLVAGFVFADIDPIEGGQTAGMVEISVPGLQSGNAIQILAVPFAQCIGNAGGSSVKLADLVSTFNLVADDSDAVAADQLIVLGEDNGTPVYFYYWLKDDGGNKVWTKLNTTSLSGAEQQQIVPPEASAFAIARGNAVWLKRPEGASAATVFLKGQVATSDPLVTIGVGLNLISFGGLTNCAINSVSLDWVPKDGLKSDKLLVLKNDGSGEFDQYTYRSGKWMVQDGTGFAVANVEVAPGKGFWYLRRGNASTSLTPISH